MYNLDESSQFSYDSVVLTKDTGVIWGLPIDGDQWNFGWFRTPGEW